MSLHEIIKEESMISYNEDEFDNLQGKILQEIAEDEEVKSEKSLLDDNKP